jgi:hypothetical protein
MAARKLDNPAQGSAVAARYRRADDAATLARCSQRLARIERLDPVSRTRPAQRPEALVRRTLKHLPPPLRAVLPAVLAAARAPEPVVQAQRLVRLLEVVHHLRLPGQPWLTRLDRALRSLAGHRGDILADPALADARRALVAEAIGLALARSPSLELFEFHGWCIAEGVVDGSVEAFWTLDLLGALAFDEPNIAAARAFTAQAVAVADDPRSEVPSEERIRMRRNHAEVLAQLGHVEDAFALLEDNLTAASMSLGEDHFAVIEHYHRLTALALERDDNESAHGYATAGCGLEAARYGAGDPAGFELRRRQAEALRGLGRVDDALMAAQLLLGDAVAACGERAVPTFEAAVQLVRCVASAGDEDRADRLAEHWYDVARLAAGTYHPTTRWFEAYLTEAG